MTCQAVIDEMSAPQIRDALAGIQSEMSSPAGDLASVAVKRIVSAYPPADMVDPQAFVDQMIEAIEDFPVCVVRDLQDPKIGIVRQRKFLPRIAEVVDWCERREYEYREIHATARLAFERHERAARNERHCGDGETRNPALPEEEARRVELKTLSALKALPGAAASNRLKRVGEDRAREQWAMAMAKALRQRPDLVDPYVSVLSDHPELVTFATDRQNAFYGTGWPDLSVKLREIYEERRDRASADARATV